MKTPVARLPSQFRIVSGASFHVNAWFCGPDSELASKAAFSVEIKFLSGKAIIFSFVETVGAEVFNPQNRTISQDSLERWFDNHLKVEYCVKEITEGTILFEASITNDKGIEQYRGASEVDYRSFEPEDLSGTDANDLKTMFH